MDRMEDSLAEEESPTPLRSPSSALALAGHAAQGLVMHAALHVHRPAGVNSAASERPTHTHQLSLRGPQLREEVALFLLTEIKAISQAGAHRF